MREAAEKKKDIEKQHAESVSNLRTAQAQLGLLVNSKNTEVERAQHSQNIESLQVRTDHQFLHSDPRPGQGYPQFQLSPRRNKVAEPI